MSFSYHCVVIWIYAHAAILPVPVMREQVYLHIISAVLSGGITNFPTNSESIQKPPKFAAAKRVFRTFSLPTLLCRLTMHTGPDNQG